MCACVCSELPIYMVNAFSKIKISRSRLKTISEKFAHWFVGFNGNLDVARQVQLYRVPLLHGIGHFHGGVAQAPPALLSVG